MKDRKWFAWCFAYWALRARFVLDNERSPVDVSERIPPEGWVP
jgi:hypothetical protein